VTDYCPTCRQPLPVQKSLPTDRELDVLAAWWMTGSVRQAAEMVGVGEQRAKNLLARCRFRSGVHSNEALLSIHMEALRSRVALGRSHNLQREEAA